MGFEACSVPVLGGRAHSRGGPWGTVLPAHLTKDNVCVQPRTPRCLGNPTSQKPQMDRGEVLIRDLVFSAQRVPGLWGHTLKAMLPAHVCVCVCTCTRGTHLYSNTARLACWHTYTPLHRERVWPRIHAAQLPITGWSMSRGVGTSWVSQVLSCRDPSARVWTLLPCSQAWPPPQMAHSSGLPFASGH